jgi:hypothetical protein
MLAYGSFSLATSSEGNGSRARGVGMKLASAGSVPGRHGPADAILKLSLNVRHIQPTLSIVFAPQDRPALLLGIQLQIDHCILA